MRRQRPRPNNPAKPAWRGKPRRAPRREGADQMMLFGLHAVEAALANPKRPVVRVVATENAAQRLGPLLAKRGLTPEPASPRDLDRLLGPDAVHQGIALEAEPLPPVTLDEVDDRAMLLVLDQVTDPQNVGAALRSAAAFGASGLVMTERHSPPLHGVLAKAASGALDLVPVILVKNLAQSLAELGERGFLRVGLAEEASEALETAVAHAPACARARRRGQRLAAAYAGALRPHLPHLDAKRACQPQRLKCGRRRVALGEPQRALDTRHRSPRSLRLIAEAAPEGIVPAVSTPVAISGAGEACGVTGLLPIGIEALRIIDEGRATAAPLTAGRRSGIRGIDTACAARGWKGRGSGNDDEAPHRNRIGRRHEDRAAGRADAPGIGAIDRQTSAGQQARGRRGNWTRFSSCDSTRG